MKQGELLKVERGVPDPDWSTQNHRQNGGVVKSKGPGARRLGFEHWSCPLLAVSSWAIITFSVP